jgi:hypothetical protein
MNTPDTLLEAAAALAATADLPLDPPAPPPSVGGWFDPFNDNAGWTVGSAWSIDASAPPADSNMTIQAFDNHGKLAATLTPDGIQCEPGWTVDKMLASGWGEV